MNIFKPKKAEPVRGAVATGSRKTRAKGSVAKIATRRLVREIYRAHISNRKIGRIQLYKVGWVLLGEGIQSELKKAPTFIGAF